MKKTISLPKIDFNNIGKKINAVDLEISFENGCFSASGTVWNNIKSDCIAAGQMLGEISKFYPNNKLVKKIVSIWSEYHLNDLTPGSPKQMAYLKSLSKPSDAEFYTWECEQLKKVNLLIDESFLHNGKPYEYGSAWLKTKIPENVQQEIFSIINENKQAA
jgi:hypothetical protein